MRLLHTIGYYVKKGDILWHRFPMNPNFRQRLPEQTLPFSWTADIPVTKQLEVGRDVTISSLFPDVFALTKAAGSQPKPVPCRIGGFPASEQHYSGRGYGFPSRIRQRQPFSDLRKRRLSLSGGRLYPAEQLFCGGRRRRLSPACPRPGQFTCNERQCPDYRLCVQNLRRRCRHVSRDLQ